MGITIDHFSILGRCASHEEERGRNGWVVSIFSMINNGRVSSSTAIKVPPSPQIFNRNMVTMEHTTSGLSTTFAETAISDQQWHEPVGDPSPQQ
jgi:hypothetical protein